MYCHTQTTVSLSWQYTTEHNIIEAFNLNYNLFLTVLCVFLVPPVILMRHFTSKEGIRLKEETNYFWECNIHFRSISVIIYQLQFKFNWEIQLLLSKWWLTYHYEVLLQICVFLRHVPKFMLIWYIYRHYDDQVHVPYILGPALAGIMMMSSNGNIICVTGHLCGNWPFTGEFPLQRPVTRCLDVFFDLCLNKQFSKQSWCWWFEMLSCSLWHHGTCSTVPLWYSSIGVPDQHVLNGCVNNVHLFLNDWFYILPQNAIIDMEFWYFNTNIWFTETW